MYSFYYPYIKHIVDTSVNTINNTSNANSIEHFVTLVPKVNTTTSKPTTKPIAKLTTTAKPTTTSKPTYKPTAKPIAKPTTTAKLTPTAKLTTTAKPTKMAPTTLVPTKMAPTTLVPTKMAPTTMIPTTMAPTTMIPTKMAPTTMIPTIATMEPTIMIPTTMAPTTMIPTTMEPTTMEQTTMIPTTMEQTTMIPTIMEQTTMAPTTIVVGTMEQPIMEAPIMQNINIKPEFNVISNDAIPDNMKQYINANIIPTNIVQNIPLLTTPSPTTSLPNILNSYINKQICGKNHNMILMKDGTLYAMGNNTYFQLGSNDTNITFNTINNYKWIDVATIYNTTFAINNIGNIYYWGNTFYNLPQVSIPTKIFFSNILQAKKIACGLNHLLVLDTSNKLYGYGNNSNFQISGDTNIAILNSTFFQISAYNYDNIYCGYNYSVITRNTGTSYITGVIGNKSISGIFKTLTDGIAVKINSISCSPNHYIYTTFTINNGNKIINNNLILYGSNEFGKIGNNINNLENGSNTISLYTPLYIYAGINNTFVVDSNKKLYVCGTYNNTNYLTFTEIANVTNDINIVSNTYYTIISYNQNIIINTTSDIVSVLQSGFNKVNNNISNIPLLNITPPILTTTGIIPPTISSLMSPLMSPLIYSMQTTSISGYESSSIAQIYTPTTSASNYLYMNESNMNTLPNMNELPNMNTMPNMNALPIISDKLFN